MHQYHKYLERLECGQASHGAVHGAEGPIRNGLRVQCQALERAEPGEGGRLFITSQKRQKAKAPLLAVEFELSQPWPRCAEDAAKRTLGNLAR
jgi:hypothetical protein